MEMHAKRRKEREKTISDFSNGALKTGTSGKEPTLPLSLKLYKTP